MTAACAEPIAPSAVVSATAKATVKRRILHSPFREPLSPEPLRVGRLGGVVRPPEMRSHPRFWGLQKKFGSRGVIFSPRLGGRPPPQEQARREDGKTASGRL